MTEKMFTTPRVEYLPRSRRINWKERSDEVRAYEREKYKQRVERIGRKLRGRPTKAVDDGNLRKCSKCETWKPRETGFYKSAKSTKGYTTKCRDCCMDDAHKMPSYGNGKAQEKYKAEIAQQPYCMICLSTERLTRDHDHKTDRIRAVLCNHCNTGIGLFRDDPELLRAAAAYLEYFR